jgi:hypothetical protein
VKRVAAVLVFTSTAPAFAGASLLVTRVIAFSDSRDFYLTSKTGYHNGATERKAVPGNQIRDETHTGITCRVCGAFLYSTDHGNDEVTYHCSSDEATFWDFERGSSEQIKAKEHWDKSRIEVFAGKNQ